MNGWEALLLGVVQGATEFLPVSSSGHLVLGQTLLGIEITGVLYEVTVHLATLISILLVYRQRVARLFGGIVRGGGEEWRYAGLLGLATFPAGIVGLTLRTQVERLFEVPAVAGVALLVTGGLLWSVRRTRMEEGTLPTAIAALAMGVAQCFALVPGISRSGATVVVGLWLGLEAREAAAFSFLMAVPVIGGAALLQLPEVVEGAAVVDASMLIVGGLAAAITGVLAIYTFVAMLRRRSFHHFAPYCWSVGGLFLVYLALT